MNSTDTEIQSNHGLVEPFLIKEASTILTVKKAIYTRPHVPTRASLAIGTGLVAVVIGAVSLLISPHTVEAGVFSLFSNLFASSDNGIVTQGSSAITADTDSNSQTISVLKANLSPDLNYGKGNGDITIVGGDAVLASTGPLGTAQDASQVSNYHQISVYTVRDGDTLSIIAKMYGVSVNTIVWANNLQSRSLSPGQTLVILPVTGVLYTVKSGDSIKSIAKKYNSDEVDIMEYNDISSDADLHAGDTLTIPDAEAGGSGAAQSSGPSWLVKIDQRIKKGLATAPAHNTNGPDFEDYYSFPVPSGVITQGLHGYNAVDIGAPTGTPIYAAAAGDVIIARGGGGWNGGYGNYVVISHPNGTQTLYGHMSKVIVSSGDRVYRGELIGYVGKTGEATGPHVHFEVRGAKNPFGDLPVGTEE
jgi:LysM repeat protein